MLDLELIPQYSYQIGPAERRGADGRRLRQLVTFKFEDLDTTGRETVKGRVAALCGLVAARNAETHSNPLPDDFPVFVAPITKVSPAKGDPTNLAVSLDSSCLGTRISHRDARVREFCGAIGDYVLGFNGEPEPDPASVTGPILAAEASEVVALVPDQPVVRVCGMLLQGLGRAE